MRPSLLTTSVLFLFACGQGSPLERLVGGPDGLSALRANDTAAEPELIISDVEEEGLRDIAGIAPYAIETSDEKIRIYYSHGASILSSISLDGLKFYEETGSRLTRGDGFETLVADPSVIPTADGGFMMFYKAAESAGETGGAAGDAHRVMSAYSTDGLHFDKVGAVLGPDETASVPEGLILDDDPYSARLYYVYFTDDTDANGRVHSAVSSDGRTFSADTGPVLGKGHVDPAATPMPEGGYLMVTTYFPDKNPDGPDDQAFYVYWSWDGVEFTNEQVLYTGAEDGSTMVLDPCVIHVADDVYRLYYWEVDLEDALEDDGALSSLTFRARVTGLPEVDTDDSGGGVGGNEGGNEGGNPWDSGPTDTVAGNGGGPAKGWFDGCGCATSGGQGLPGALGLMAAAGLVAARRRRR